MTSGFDCPITTTLTGPLRSPAQMLDDQTYDGHTSVHDEATAASLGLRGAPIEGPTHFSQFDPLAFARWGPMWFERGCISAHFQNMVVQGEQVRATLMTDRIDATTGRIDAAKADGTPVLTGTASIGPNHATTELDARRARVGDPGELFIIDRLTVGDVVGEGLTTGLSHDEPNGDLYPFSLAQKLARITEPHPWYTPEGGASSPWGRAIVPFEMISVLAMKVPIALRVRTPSVGLFLDLEVRLLRGPLLVGETYGLRRTILATSQSKRTESYWTETSLTDVTSGQPVASVILHSGVFKESYPDYPRDRLA